MARTTTESPTGREPGQHGLARGSATRFIVLIGVVSLFSDMTYESARSISGPFLATLGASAGAVGFVAGLGELLGYGVRLVSGRLSDRTGRYWPITFTGYVVNLLAVPMLALAQQWPVAAALIVGERAGRGIRTPVRDAMLSHAARGMGLGWGFGLHEALDQTGAVVGPLLLSLLLYRHGDYRTGFALLLAPALLALAFLLVARRLYPRPRDLELADPEIEFGGLPPVFWIYLAGVACMAAGYADFALVAFHFQHAAIVPPFWIPAIYALAMATDGAAALILGPLFDRIGMRAMLVALLLAVLAVPLAFLGGPTAAVIGMGLWGVGMGAQESVLRAAVARLTPPARRGTAYGVFNALSGAAWFVGSIALGVLYDRSVPALVVVGAAPARRRAVSLARRPLPGDLSVQAYLMVALGGALGSIARFWCSGVAARAFGETFPWGTLIVNVAGSFVIGIFATLTGPDGRLFVAPDWRTFVMVGICGGFTTFSSFSLQTLSLVRETEYLYAAGNVLASVALCLATVWLGHVAAMSLNAMR